MMDFDWPCDRRVAHGPHTAYQQPEDRCYPYDCPGVRAHPLTQIGKPPSTPDDDDLVLRMDEFSPDYLMRCVRAYPVISGLRNDNERLMASSAELDTAYRRVLRAKGLRRTHELYLEEQHRTQ